MSDPAAPAPDTTPAAPAAPATAPAPQPTPAPDTTPAPAPDTPAPAPAPAAKENLLAATDPAATDKPPAAPAADPAAPPAPAPEAVAALADAITPALDPLPDGSAMPVDEAAIQQVASVFARHGVPQAAARDVVAAYAAHARQQVIAAQAADAALNASMVAECRRVLGPDLPRYIAEARAGGADIFGKELFAQLCSVEAFANDHRIISALAARGRAVTSDPAPGGAGTKTDERDLAARLYGPPAG